MVIDECQVKIDHLKTETPNPRTLQLDTMSTMDILKVMNEEDHHILETIKDALPQIEKTVQSVIEALEKGGRLIYSGAGTSGRLGILDAVECVPTFSTTDEVIGVIAGGDDAFIRAKEGAEDSKELGREDLESVGLNCKDIVVAIAASGRTPYCIGALEYARQIGAICISLSCNKNAELSDYADIAIEVDAGPEILTGSTRLKAGTCQKMILNMISTASMIGIGKVYGNLMVDMKATNLKLKERAKRIVMMSTQCDESVAIASLEASDQSIKAAIVMIITGVSKVEADKRLASNHGFVRRCLG